MFNNKIPPPLVMLACAVLGGYADGLYLTNRPVLLILGIISVVSGLWLAFVSIVSFKHAKTTVNPLDPSQASQLVSHGVFRYSRNPMYLSLSLLLLAWSCLLASLTTFVLCFVFVLYITQFQIKPEEKALLLKFGKQYEEYCRRVRRWL